MTAAARWFPSFAPLLAGYGAAAARADLIAGLTVALFSIPQAMAYALIAGFPPMVGIYTAVVASIAGAIFGSSEFLINGPTNAIVVMIAANAAVFASQGDPLRMIVLLTLMIGIMQTVAAILKVGSFTRFVSEPVLTGFTAGAGLYITINQLPSLLGLDKSAIAPTLGGWTPPKAAFFDLLRTTLSVHGVNPVTLGLGVTTFFLVRGIQRFERRARRRLPGPFLAIFAVTVGSWAAGLGEPDAGIHKIKLVRDIEPLSRHLPDLVFPAVHWADVHALLGPMFAIGLMGAVEAIAIGKALAGRAGHPFDASRQLLGEGLCNVAASLVGGFASSGSFSRTAVNYEAGAVTRLSVIASGVLVLVLVLVFAPFANYIPIAALAGTLMHIGLKLVDVARLRALFEVTFNDRIVLLATLVGVLVTEQLETALFVGIGLSIFLALRRAEGFKLTQLVEGEDGVLVEATGDAPPSDVLTVNLQGELFFAAADDLGIQLRRLLDRTRFLVLRVQEAYNMDATTAETIASVADRARARGGRLILCGVRPGMYGTFARARLVHHLGEDAIFRAEASLLSSTRKAIRHAEGLAHGARTQDPTAEPSPATAKASSDAAP